MSFCLNLKIIPSCHTLLNVFDISRKTLLALNPSSKDLHILRVVDKIWLKLKSPGLRHDGFGEIRPFLIKNGNISLIIKRSRILLQTGSNDRGG